MQSVGTRLREARIKKGYTLEEINARTRISLKNLSAIESDDLSKISSPFTYRSFVKQIADLVGVDHATLAADALAASSTMPEPLVPGQEEEVYVRPHQYQPIKPKSNLSWLKMASIAGVAGVVSIYLIWRNGGIGTNKLPASTLPASSRMVTPEETAPAVAAVQEQAARQTLVAAPPAVDATVAANNTSSSVRATAPQTDTVTTPPPAPGTEQLLPPASRTESGVHAVTVSAGSAPTMQNVAQSVTQDTEAAKIHIELSAIQPTWLSISADGKTTYSGTLGAMKTMTFDGKESAQIRTANAGGVNIIFNGHALGPLGRRGQSRTFVFTKTGYEVVQGGGSLAKVIPTGG